MQDDGDGGKNGESARGMRACVQEDAQVGEAGHFSSVLLPLPALGVGWGMWRGTKGPGVRPYI